MIDLYTAATPNQREVRRLFEVLERQLTANAYVAGNEYSIADIAHWSWIHGHEWSGVTLDTGRKILV
jgi:glutathione S-transferase